MFETLKNILSNLAVLWDLALCGMKMQIKDDKRKLKQIIENHKRLM